MRISDWSSDVCSSDLATLSYAEVKALASGNPMVIEKAGVDAEVAKLSTLFSVWRHQRWANESEVGRLPMLLESSEERRVGERCVGPCRSRWLQSQYKNKEHK